MVYAMLITIVYKINQQAFTNNLAGFSVLWGQLLSVTTFTLTFFLNQSYALWRNCYSYSRKLQGRLNDLNMTLAAHAKRVEPNDKDDNSDNNSNSNSNSNSVDMNGSVSNESIDGGANGSTPNVSTINVSTIKGSAINGSSINGSVNGSMTNGSTTNGSSNGSINGSINGSVTNGSALFGTKKSGSVTNGSVTNGSTTNGSTTNGSTMNGSTMNGSTMNGSVNGSTNSIPSEVPSSIFRSRFSTYTEPAKEVLELMGRYTRVFNLLTYASFTGSHRPLLTPQGMRRMVDRGILTESERLILSDVQLPVTQRHNAILLWMMRLFEDARQSGHLEGSSGFEQQFLEKCHVIRAQYGSIGDELQGRMPLAYAHIVQVLVDVILWMYPFMAFSNGMTPFLSVIGTGLLTMFYQGLFNLAKQFLDPYDNESYGKGEDPLCIDTLIAESNAGSVRWMNGLAEVPYSVDKVKDGDLLDYKLPMRGWTVEQTEEREEEARIAQLEREAEEAEKKLAEEAGLVEPAPILEIIEDDEMAIRDDVDDECDTDEALTMEEALEKMETCTEKVP
jgi:hypothetical protein